MFTGSNTSSELKIFIGSTIVQLILFFILINNSFSGTYTASNETNSYLKDVKWGTYPITQTLSISMPFELKDSESVLPGYMEHYISNHQSSKAESSESFSLTIEKMEFDDVYKIQNSDLISINDAYMKSPGVTKVKEEGLHTEINGYKTYVEYGSYTLNGKEYLYENYTLTKDDEGVKIILSYLKDDHLLSKYANIVSQSLLINKQVI